MTLVQVHAAAVCAWFGLVAGETVMELCARDAASRRFVKTAHAWIDRLFEIPLIMVALFSGVMLLSQSWPASPLLLAKVACGLIAIAANFVCIPYVQMRAKAKDDVEVQRLTRNIIFTGSAIPFGLAAMVIGFGYLA